MLELMSILILLNKNVLNARALKINTIVQNVWIITLIKLTRPVPVALWQILLTLAKIALISFLTKEIANFAS